MARQRSEKVHPIATQARDLYVREAISRREFLRYAGLVGLTTVAACALAGIPAPAIAAPAKVPFAAADPNATPGGSLRISTPVAAMDDPARTTSVDVSNQYRQVVEYLTIIDRDGITHPMLASRWEVSNDLKTWTFFIRKDVRWHNGEELIAEHIRWNFQRWLDPALSSPNAGLLSVMALSDATGRPALGSNTTTAGQAGKSQAGKGQTDDGARLTRLRPDAVEIVDRHTIRFHLSKPVLTFPEELYNYPAAILHPSFTPPFSRNPIGTGPYTLASLKPGAECVFNRVRQRLDGKPFEYWGGEVFLDEIRMLDPVAERPIEAVLKGLADVAALDLSETSRIGTVPGTLSKVRSSQTLCFRMKLGEAPFDDIRVRRAVLLACSNTKIKESVAGEHGDVAANVHVAPAQPDFSPISAPARDIAQARRLLEEAGKHNLALTLHVGRTAGEWVERAAEAVRDQIAEAGIAVGIRYHEAQDYWRTWQQHPFAATLWAHRPLGTMVLSLGYRTGAVWNETGYANAEFDKALDEAEATLDLEKRRAKMATVQEIMSRDAIALIPFFLPRFVFSSPNVKGLMADPTGFYNLHRVWIS